MSELTATERVEGSCPKRPWVMSTLADDERLGTTGQLPQALRFHIARCKSCRALADELTPATRALSAMGQSEPPADLLAAAQAQAIEAIDGGAALTGRVPVPDVDEPMTLSRTARIPMRSFRYAAAAVLVVGFTSFWIGRHTAPQGPEISGRNARELNPPPVTSLIDLPGKAPKTSKVEKFDSEPDDGARLAASTDEDTESGKQHRTRRICQQQAYDESALLGDGDCVPSILVRPDTRQRNLGWGGIFDRPAPEDPKMRLLGQKTNRRR